MVMYYVLFYVITMLLYTVVISIRFYTWAWSLKPYVLQKNNGQADSYVDESWEIHGNLFFFGNGFSQARLK